MGLTLRSGTLQNTLNFHPNYLKWSFFNKDSVGLPTLPDKEELLFLHKEHVNQVQVGSGLVLFLLHISVLYDGQRKVHPK